MIWTYSFSLHTAMFILGANGQGHEITIDDVQVVPVHEVYVPAKETGALSSLRVNIGDHVKSSDVLACQQSSLAEIDRELAKIDYQVAKLNAQSDLDQDFLQISLESARNELTRSLKANQEKPRSISETEIDLLRLKVEKSQMDLAKSERDFAMAQLQAAQSLQRLKSVTEILERHEIQAPIDGRVEHLFHQPGEWLKPGEPVARIVAIGQLQVMGYVNESKLPDDIVGCAAKLAIARSAHAHEVVAATIVDVSHQQRTTTGLVSVTARFDNPRGRLRPGMRGTLTIQVHPVKTPKSTDDTKDIHDSAAGRD